MAAKRKRSAEGEAALSKKAVAAAAKKLKTKLSTPGKTHKKESNRSNSSVVRDKRKVKPTTKTTKNFQEKTPKRPLTSKEKKDALRKKKAKLKPNFNVIQEITALWEKTRPSEVPVAEKQAAVPSILEKVKGRIPEFSMSHTASRIIQFCLKHGGDEARKAVMAEMKGRILDMAKSSYGNFVARKIINTAPKEN
eukprot:CAMPEP_0177585784 /NCGR_PEP_ID=MMETSP0419_2-20121207/4699_1 /TAXON_ID=582737 /ORGANISM="Tetraselmis sp., Strain GSL018" /LENGTH=193 /DNA_ID=CAMNT_0019075583 /DNA_START=178 /DNA_END=756 /DNA_ORIENTATION=-